MPQTGMDGWVIAGVIVAIIAAIIAWKQLRGGSTKTTNTIEGGNRNTQSGGDGTTVNSIKDGDDNQQSG